MAQCRGYTPRHRFQIFSDEGSELMAVPPKEVTRLLRAWRDGDQTALDELMPLIYHELRRIAAHYLRRERRRHTLQTTALVN